MHNTIDKLKIAKHPIHFLAFGLGLGFLPVAPGTFGTLLGVFIYIANYLYFGINLILLSIITFFIGIYLCGKTSLDINYHDHPGIVWDEVVGYLITMIFIPFNTVNIILGFLLFRFFDILKPWPIRQLDEKVIGGFGIMIDDVLAAIYANVSLNIILLMLNL